MRPIFLQAPFLQADFLGLILELVVLALLLPVLGTLALLALDVTVKVELPAWSAVNVADPDNPVPDTFIVNVPLFGAVSVAQEVFEPLVCKYLPLLPVCDGNRLFRPASAVEAFVPPLAIGKIPDTWVVNPTLPQLGAEPTPPEISALPVATSANLLNVVEPDA